MRDMRGTRSATTPESGHTSTSRRPRRRATRSATGRDVSHSQRSSSAPAHGAEHASPTGTHGAQRSSSARTRRVSARTHRDSSPAKAHGTAEKPESRSTTPAATSATAASASGASSATNAASATGSATATSTSGTPTFAELGVAAEIVDALAEHGITHTFAIQELTLPIALEGTDIIGQARTGMGKTLAFGVPLLDRIFDDAAIAELDGSPRALIIAPTRELAGQVSDDLRQAAAHLTVPPAKPSGKPRPLRVVTIFGGHSIEDQIEEIRRGADTVVGTPGRLLDLVHRGELDLSQVAVLVLDEADEMLDLGFLPDIEKLLDELPDERQTMLFSATMPGAILNLARTMMDRPIHIRAEGADDSATHTTTKQVAFKNHKLDKIATLSKILQGEGRERTIIFTRTKRSAATVAEALASRGYLVGAVHGDMPQPAREKSLEAFRNKKIDILVATDVAARGIDIDDVTHVINYQVPDDEMTYVHRIGRTGRAGHSGTAVTMVGWDEVTKWKAIDDALGLEYGELPEWFSTSPELFDALDIPSDAAEAIGESRPVFGGARTLSPMRKSAHVSARRRGSSARSQSRQRSRQTPNRHRGSRGGRQ